MRPGAESGQKSTSGARWLAIGFLVINVPIETAYAWGAGLVDPYYIIKVVAWALLLVGVWRARPRPTASLAFIAAGWGWLAANFARATADRVSVSMPEALSAGARSGSGLRHPVSWSP